MPETPAPPRPRGRRLRSAVGALGVLGSIVLGVLSVTTIRSGDTFTQLDIIVATAAALSLVLSGAVLMSRLPSHPIGWLLWAGGCLFGIASGASGLAQVLPAGATSLGAWVVLAGQSGWVPAIVCVTVLLPLVFPTGRLPSSRWRIVIAVGVMSAAFSIVQKALTPFDPTGVPVGMTNPIAATGVTADLANLLGGVSSLAGVVCLPLVAASLVLRFRHASGVERAQLKWLASAVAIAGPALAVAIASSALPGDLAAFVSNVAYLLMFVGLTLLPVAIGIAVLRYRLYDIDLIIRRTVVYVPLTAILAGLYAGSTALFQKAFIIATGQRSDGAIIASTLILATVFTPIRSWLQGVVDRRFRDQLDTERLLQAFVARVANAEWTPDPARTLRSFLGVAIGALGATAGRAVLVDGPTTHVVASVGQLESAALVVSVASGDRRFGVIELAPRGRGKPYRQREIEFLEDAARGLAAAILGGDHGVAPASAAADGVEPERARAAGPEVQLGAERTQG